MHKTDLERVAELMDQFTREENTAYDEAYKRSALDNQRLVMELCLANQTLNNQRAQVAYYRETCEELEADNEQLHARIYILERYIQETRNQVPIIRPTGNPDEYEVIDLTNDE